jgi:uncharacterized membrane protein
VNKTANTVIFMICATALNLILILILFVAFIMIASFALDSGSGSQVVTIVYGLCILLSIGGGFFIYNRIIKWVNNKWHLEDHILTGFSRKK